MNQYDMSRARVPGQAPEAGMPAAHNAGPNKKVRNMGPLRIIITMLIVSIAILALVLMVFVVFGGGKTESDLIKKDKYQAVFLNDSTGQVYFGKLTSVNNKYYKLTDIYYVRVSQAVQPDKSTDNTAAQQNISLAKLGSELHGPEDEMYISRDQVLFWENLKDDGQVVKAIVEYKKTGGTTTPPATSNTTTPTTTTTTPKK